MRKLEAVICYLLDTYPHKRDMVDYRLTKTVYLIDWVSCKRHDKQITKTMWLFDRRGPYVDDILIESLRSKNIKAIYLDNPSNPYFTFIGDSDEVLKALTEEEISVIDFVIKHTKALYTMNFEYLVDSTHPFFHGTEKQIVDLRKISRDHSVEEGDEGFLKDCSAGESKEEGPKGVVGRIIQKLLN